MRNLLTGEKKMHIDEPTFGEIGDCYGNWLIEDYADELLDQETPEDF